MVLGCQDSVLHPGVFGDSGPFSWVVIIRVELIKKLLVILDTDPLLVANPFSSCGDRVQTPVNEHSESRVLEPLDAFVAASPHLASPSL